MVQTVKEKQHIKQSTSASLGYSLAMIKMFLNNELITEEEHAHIEEIIERHYANS